MSVVPYFFVRCLETAVPTIQENVREVWQLEFVRVSRDDYPVLERPEPAQAWFCADTGVGAYDEPLESEIAKRLLSDPAVFELRVGSDSLLPDGIEIVNGQHRLVTRSVFGFRPPSWLVDEGGRRLLDHNGRPLPGLDFKHQRMALLAQAFVAVDMWMTDEQWLAVDEWMVSARIGGMG